MRCRIDVTELPGGHILDLRGVGDCGPHDHPLRDGRFVSAIHDADVRKIGHQLGCHVDWWHCASPRAHAVFVLQVWFAYTQQELVLALHRFEGRQVPRGESKWGAEGVGAAGTKVMINTIIRELKWTR